MACRRSPVRARLAPFGEPPQTRGFFVGGERVPDPSERGPAVWPGLASMSRLSRDCGAARAWLGATDRARCGPRRGARPAAAAADEEVVERTSDLRAIAALEGGHGDVDR